MMYLGTNLNFVESNTTIYQHRLKLDSGKTYLITVNAVENGETLKADDLDTDAEWLRKSAEVL